MHKRQLPIKLFFCSISAYANDPNNMAHVPRTLTEVIEKQKKRSLSMKNDLNIQIRAIC